MTGCLVRQQVDVDVVVDRVFYEIHRVAVKGNGKALFLALVLKGEFICLGRIIHRFFDPALIQPGLYPRIIYLRDDGHAVGDFHGFTLGAAHAAQPGRYEQIAGQVLISGDAELCSAGVEDGVVGAVHDALGADIHPPPGGHLAIVGHTQRHGAVPVFLIVEATHHQRIGDDGPGCMAGRCK